MQTGEKDVPQATNENIWLKYEVEITGFIGGLLIVFFGGGALKLNFVSAGVIFSILGLVVSVLSIVAFCIKYEKFNKPF
jgi:hypothetical protein